MGQSSMRQPKQPRKRTVYLMKYPLTTRYSILSAMLLVLLAACGGQGDEVFVPTETPRPPILTMFVPPVDTAISEEADAAALTALKSEIQKRTGMVIDVQRMASYGDALKAVCDTHTTLTIAWLDGITSAAALAQDCGLPYLQIARIPEVEVQLVNEDGSLIPTEEANATAEIDATDEANATDEVNATAEADATTEAAATEETGDTAATDEPAATDDIVATEETAATQEVTPASTDESAATEEAATGEPVATEEPALAEISPEDLARAVTGLPGVIVVNSSFGTVDLALADSRTFCRRDASDFYGWLLPTLMFKAENLDLISDNITVVDYDSTGAILQAINTGDCAMAGVSQAVVDAGLPENVVVAQTTVQFPFGILIYPPEIESGVRRTLNETLLAMAVEPESSAILKPLLNQLTLLPAVPDDITNVENFIASTGLNLAQLGQ
ncbi:MAG TPA: PhnD/SsuA/transferrin family substrate-binding protein [Phototrophicaceae bacterium]|nr:PhnD/SsuA/transferrin family substrate-binding protein [Phototrophicaceae bacterium]